MTPTAPTLVLTLLVSCAAASYLFAEGATDLGVMMLFIGACGIAGELWRANKRSRG